MGTDLRRQTLKFTDNHLLRGLSVLVVLNLHLMRVLNPMAHVYEDSLIAWPLINPFTILSQQ
jgi:hypothetical protein